MSLALWNGLITAAYSSGHIRIFDLALGILKIEICAHSRCINSLDIASEAGLVSLQNISLILTVVLKVTV